MRTWKWHRVGLLVQLARDWNAYADRLAEAENEDNSYAWGDPRSGEFVYVDDVYVCSGQRWADANKEFQAWLRSDV